MAGAMMRSGGEKKRVAVAVELMGEPSVMVRDGASRCNDTPLGLGGGRWGPCASALTRWELQSQRQAWTRAPPWR
jgi:hypothetical protein